MPPEATWATLAFLAGFLSSRKGLLWAGRGLPWWVGLRLTPESAPTELDRLDWLVACLIPVCTGETDFGWGDLESCWWESRTGNDFFTFCEGRPLTASEVADLGDQLVDVPDERAVVVGGGQQHVLPLRDGVAQGLECPLDTVGGGGGHGG